MIYKNIKKKLKKNPESENSVDFKVRKMPDFDTPLTNRPTRVKLRQSTLLN